MTSSWKIQNFGRRIRSCVSYRGLFAQLAARSLARRASRHSGLFTVALAKSPKKPSGVSLKLSRRETSASLLLVCAGNIKAENCRWIVAGGAASVFILFVFFLFSFLILYLLFRFLLCEHAAGRQAASFAVLPYGRWQNLLRLKFKC